MDLLHYIPDHWDTLGPEVLTQIELPLMAVSAAAVLGLVMGIWGARSTRADAFFTAFNSSLLTVPSYALFALIAIGTGTGNWPVVIGLALYALLPVQRNTTAGIQAVRAEVAKVRIPSLRPFAVDPIGWTAFYENAAWVFCKCKASCSFGVR